MHITSLLENNLNDMCKFLIEANKIKEYNIPSIQFSNGIKYYIGDKEYYGFSNDIKLYAFYNMYTNTIGMVVDEKPKYRLEYQDYSCDPIIGSIVADFIPCLLATLSHEIAHWFRDNFTKPMSLEQNSHDYLWKPIYKKLREQFVNNRNNIYKIGFQNEDLYNIIQHL